MIPPRIASFEPIPAWAAPPSWDHMQIPDSVRKGVFFLGWKIKGRFTPRATGFIVSIKLDGYRAFFGVTAQHCIARLYEPDAQGEVPKVYSSINRMAGAPQIEEVPYDVWHFHPDAHEPVDVAVSPMILDERIHDFTHGPLDEFALTDEIIRELNITTGDEIFVVGLFRNHYGRNKNIPIVRSGNIAGMPDEPISSAFGHVSGYLVECRSIGGLSGSPVFVYVGGTRLIGNTFTPFKKGKGFYLLGLMHGHFDIKDLNLDILEEDHAKASPTGIHSGVGIVVPSSKIVETIKQDAIMTECKKAVEQLKAETGGVLDVASEEAPPATAVNPNHQADFMRLVGAAAQKPKQGD